MEPEASRGGKDKNSSASVAGAKNCRGKMGVDVRLGGGVQSQNTGRKQQDPVQMKKEDVGKRGRSSSWNCVQIDVVRPSWKSQAAWPARCHQVACS